MANRDGAAHIAQALRSVLAQSMAEIEVIVVDDASTDASPRIVEEMAEGDARIRLIRRAQAGGPAAARNDALQRARGDFIAIVDADDMILPDRLQTLVAAAEWEGADIIADDLVLFQDDASAPPRRLLRGDSPCWISAEQWVRANRPFGAGPQLGYLKPVIRRAALTRHAIAYDERLRIAEDYDLLLRLLLAGARMRLLPRPGYLYRRHGGSISHRLPAGTLEAMRLADAGLRPLPGTTPTIAAAMDQRLRAIVTAQVVQLCMVALKDGRPGAALAAMARRPAALPIVARFGWQALRRRMARPPKPAVKNGPAITVISRQRITPSANGSSAYLVATCDALRDAGFSLNLVSPTPGSFGRMPVLRVDALDGTFDSMAFRGGLRVGPWLVATNPRVHAMAWLGLAARLLMRAGLPCPAVWSRPAPYAMALPWVPDDLLFVARHAQGRADAILCDYAFTLPAAGFALAPAAPVAVLMHDLLSARAESFIRQGAADSVAVLNARAEAAALSQADIAIAIQAEEAEAARRMLPATTQVVVAPMVAHAVEQPQPGQGGGLLFVGSATPPNRDAMRWFLAEIWPELRARHPRLTLRVAGHVSGTLSPAPGVELLGRVEDLAALYRAAEIVVSPLLAGSGLKIKLVEALAAGKAIVASPVTLQGVGPLTRAAVAQAETAAQFIAQIDHLLLDPAARGDLAARALEAARSQFGAQSAHGPLIAALRAALSAQPQPLAARAA